MPCPIAIARRSTTASRLPAKSGWRPNTRNGNGSRERSDSSWWNPPVNGRTFMRDWRFWRWRKADDDEMDREIGVHLELAAEERRQAGAPERDAERAARREFGSVTLTREELRDMRTGAGLEQMWRDFAEAIRTMPRDPTVNAIRVLNLALGNGGESPQLAA